MELQAVKQRFGIIGNAPGLNYALNVAITVAPTDLSVLITGESGVGKENFSKIIHSLSTRKHNQFIAVNCGAIPEGTIDSELFGHEKGSFTGAVDSRKGYFEQVDKGTIFLDEIGEMPLGTQARLLRVLETKEFIRVGSSKVQKTDVRIIAATNIDLLTKIAEGKFREDLYYRLNTVPIKVPALRERREDITVLFRKFAVDFAEKYNTSSVKLDEEAEKILINYNWPGNVRELKNIAEQISVLSKGKIIGAEELLKFIPNAGKSNLPVLLSSLDSNAANSGYSEREILYKVLFDMKNDLNDLKKVVFELSQGRMSTYKGANIPSSIQNFVSSNETDNNDEKPAHQNKPVIIHQEHNDYAEETVEESLSIAEKEKELIIKALDKHRGKRKNAATDLGISERTLYRKIKEYGIEE